MKKYQKYAKMFKCWKEKSRSHHLAALLRLPPRRLRRAVLFRVQQVRHLQTAAAVPPRRRCRAGRASPRPGRTARACKPSDQQQQGVHGPTVTAHPRTHRPLRPFRPPLRLPAPPPLWMPRPPWSPFRLRRLYPSSPQPQGPCPAAPAPPPPPPPPPAPSPSSARAQSGPCWPPPLRGRASARQSAVADPSGCALAPSEKPPCAAGTATKADRAGA